MRFLGLGLWVWGSGLWDQGSGFAVQGSGIRVGGILEHDTFAGGADIQENLDPQTLQYHRIAPAT